MFKKIRRPKQEEEWWECEGVTNKRNEEEGDRGQGATSKEAKVKRQDGFTSCDLIKDKKKFKFRVLTLISK